MIKTYKSQELRGLNQKDYKFKVYLDHKVDSRLVWAAQ